MSTSSAPTSVDRRLLCYNFKILSRSSNVFFFRRILGMKVIRHEEIKESCDETCKANTKNWYDNRWSRTWFAYGKKTKHFVIELVYTYGAKKLEIGNDFGFITIKAADVLERATLYNYPATRENGLYILTSPDGYKFHIIDEARVKGVSPLLGLTLNSNDLAACKQYWHGLLRMRILAEDSSSIQFSYADNQIWLCKKHIADAIDRAKKFGRLAFSVPPAEQQVIETAVLAANHPVVPSMAFTDLPDVQMVKVIMLTDPDGLESVFAQEEPDFYGEDDPELDLEIFIARDPFDEKEFLTH